MSKEKLWYLVVGAHFSHRRFLNPCLMSFPSYKFCKFPLEQYSVCFMKMSSASAAITHTPAIMCTMQNGRTTWCCGWPAAGQRDGMTNHLSPVNRQLLVLHTSQRSKKRKRGKAQGSGSVWCGEKWDGRQPMGIIYCCCGAFEEPGVISEQ